MSSHRVTHTLPDGYRSFTKTALVKMLEEADAGSRYSSMPIHKRRMATEDEEDGDDEMSKEADEDREARADLADSTRPGNAPPISPEDMPRAVSKRYGEKKKSRGK